MKVSIIIPIYNVEKYIERCINSVLNQTYRNLELILINDCTPDQSMEIAQRIINNSEKSKDLEVKYISHTANKGIAATRNTGMKNVSGEYFFFLDSDDEITPNCIESMVTLALKYKKVDLIQGNTIDTNNKKIKSLDLKNIPEYIDNKNILKKLMFNDGSITIEIPHVVWNKLIRTELIRNNDMYFKEGIIAEDVYWLLNYWNNFNSVCFNSNPTYYYYNIPNSITNSIGQKERALYARLVTYRDLFPKLASKDYYIFKDSLLYIHNSYSVMNKINNKNIHFYSFYKETLQEFLMLKNVPLRIKIGILYLLLPKLLVKRKILIYIIK